MSGNRILAIEQNMFAIADKNVCHEENTEEYTHFTPYIFFIFLIKLRK